ncbi:MFS transporter [Egicoccus sp. AB-alg6-2]|uniref:MFS transporter n=1 Tax=Egicoccus sp. AB-alg6-2 TaxID=3242692 RepID=UPI00359D9931
MARPAVLRHRDFNLYWSGVVLSEIGTRGTFAAVLYHVYLLSGSSLQVGFVGLAQAVALLVLSPLGGAIADRLDRRRLLQLAQSLSLLASLTLAVVTLIGAVEVWHIILAVLFNTAAGSFERPARDALIPALVPREQLVHAFALLNPSREVAILIGPAIAGVLMAVWGPEAMYLLDVVTYVAIILALFLIRIPPVAATKPSKNLWSSIGEGVRFVRGRPIILQLMALDLSATVFGAYRVLLPALATDVLAVGATGYGILSAAPSAGALIGSAIIFRMMHRLRAGRVVLAATVAYGAMAVALVWAGLLPVTVAFVAAIAAATGLGLFDAMATTVRHAAVQLETPDEIRGRVTSIYQMASRGGPALGNLNIGWLASLLGPIGALTVGGLVPMAVSGALFVTGGRIRDYEVDEPHEDVEESAPDVAVAPDARPDVPEE